MKKARTYIFLIVLLIMVVSIMVSSCSSNDNKTGYDSEGSLYYPGGEEFTEIVENGFVKTSEQPTTNVSLDSSTANYGYLRDQVFGNKEINPAYVNIEEILNYFRYDYPVQDELLKIYGELGNCPWNNANKLVSYTVRAQDIAFNQTNGNNLVFLIDISGSMSSRIELIKASFKLLVDNLGDNDVVSLVTYNEDMKVVFEGLKGKEKIRMLEHINSLVASGGTAFSSAIGTCYDIAAKYKIDGGNNRIVLATDGDFNIGITGKDDLATYMRSKANSGIYFTACGFGIGNRKSSQIDNLAQNGNGTAAYIDSIEEAKKVFIEEIGANFITVAKDVKAQVTFNPDFVEAYRILGYENKVLSDSEYEDDGKDAGEITSGHVVTIMIELRMNEDYLNASGNYSEMSVKYKDATEEINQSVTKEIKLAVNHDTYLAGVSYNFLFAQAVVETCLIIRKSMYQGSASLVDVQSRLIQLLAIKTDIYKTEFLEIVNLLIEQGRYSGSNNQ